MTNHIVCRECTFEGIVSDEEKADRIADEHRDETGHRVVVGEVEK